MPQVLVVDDEKSLRYALERGLKSDDLEVTAVGSAKEALSSLKRSTFDAVILDLRLPDAHGLSAYKQIRTVDSRLPVIVITAHGTTETAIEAMKLGAFDYVLKPFDLHELREIVALAVSVSRQSRIPAVFDQSLLPLQSYDADVDRIIGRCAPMQALYKSIGRVAPQDITVLVLGESGTGKELIARALYQHSQRNNNPFLAINCAAIPDALLESELFGHERGAFTGADRRRIGKFEQANQGTLFLDEVGDMSLATQAKLLRVLQQKTFERVGGNASIQTDVRLIAATNQDLDARVASGQFRQDLYYRLNVVTIRVPALRARLEDLPLLLDYFLVRTSRELGKDVHSVAPEAFAILNSHSWPGNVRELQSAVTYAVLHATGPVIVPEWLPPGIRDSIPSQASATTDQPFDLGDAIRASLNNPDGRVYDQIHLQVDRMLLDEVLRQTNGNQVVAADLLGISRNTLRGRLRALGMLGTKKLSAEFEQPAQ